MYDEMKKTNEYNLEANCGMRNEFAEEVNFMERKYEYFLDNNPLDMNIKLIKYMITLVNL